MDAAWIDDIVMSIVKFDDSYALRLSLKTVIVKLNFRKKLPW